MHGRIYVEKNKGLEKERQRNLQRHYDTIKKIGKGKQSAFDFKEISKSTDEQMMKIHNMKEMNRGYREIGKKIIISNIIHF